jgi:LysM repeat protein
MFGWEASGAREDMARASGHQKEAFGANVRLKKLNDPIWSGTSLQSVESQLSEALVSTIQKAIPILCGGLAAAVLFALSGCAVAPSKTVSGAATGAVIGGVGGAVIGNNTGSGSGASGAAIGGAAGAVVGGVIGMVQEARERSEQDRLAQERAYQQELAKRRAQEARFKAAIEEELSVAEGFRISEREIAQVEGQAQELESKLKQLQEEKQAALTRKRSLDAAQGRISAAELEIQRLEAELAELRGEAAGASPARVQASIDGTYVEHRVQKGETLLSIAARYRVTVTAIREANAPNELTELTPGQVLRIPVPATTASASATPAR